MASQWAAPPPGYPAGHGQAYGHQQLATPPPPAATAVAVTAASNGVGNPYVVVTPASATPFTGQTVTKALGRYCKLLEEGTRKAADTTGNIWHHLRTAPNMADAAVARLAQGTKVYAEGGHDRVFYQTFGAMPGEQLRKAYACYLSTSSGPVIGTLYLHGAPRLLQRQPALLPGPCRPAARVHVLQGGASPEPSDVSEPFFQHAQSGGEVHSDHDHG